ncbi:hypothetical protein RJ639_030482 [Escallonia herrerae]|uniref:Uncharacterized protein n=1 Tax=Escallonia herrerae TaxID=1293975 RepID=A0AA88X2D7_9ASTE|nr:hypothetical protein RJ639_030482 [Escallonia herrerae]
MFSAASVDSASFKLDREPKTALDSKSTRYGPGCGGKDMLVAEPPVQGGMRERDQLCFCLPHGGFPRWGLQGFAPQMLLQDKLLSAYRVSSN